MTKTCLFLALLLTRAVSFTQTLHSLEPVSEHYKELQGIRSKPNPERAWMDTIKYPPKEYGSSLTFVLVKPRYLSEQEVKTIRDGITFPANSSDQTRKELDYLLVLQNNRTAQQKKRVEFLADIGYWPQINLLPSHNDYEQNLKDLFFEGREINGDWCTAKNFPHISKLLQGIMQDMRIMEFTVKYKLLRPRPYHLEPGLEPLTRINSPSFASGHTLWAFLQAYAWSEIIPGKRNNFIALAEEIRRSREIMGIHYPSDNEASRQIAYKMLGYYFKNEKFKKDFQEAVAEWKTESKKFIK
jgi:acid phosphatase (class A)